MHDSREVPLRRQLMCMKTMPLIKTYMHNSREAPLKGRLMCTCTITFSSWMVVLNQLVSHLLDLHRSYTGLPVAYKQ